MADPKNIQYRFGLRGLITQGDGELLADGQYRSMLNMDALQEGLLYSRTGRHRLGQMAGTVPNCTRIQKLVLSAPPYEDPATPQVNPRYLGVVDTSTGTYNLYRTPNLPTSGSTLAYVGLSFLKVAEAICPDALVDRFALVGYSTGNTGSAWAYIAARNKMLKDRGSAPYTTVHGTDILLRWGILPAFGVALVDYAGAGGQDSSVPGSTPYDYRYTYFAGDTGSEGNPSQTMNDDPGPYNAHGGLGPDGAAWIRAVAPPNDQDRYHNIDLVNQAASIVCFISSDPQVTGINIYRRGGILFDAWRLVGSVPNVEDPAHPGSGVTAPFTDNAPDAIIVSQKLLELDNDPPVPSTPPRPIYAQAVAPVVPGVQVITATIAGLFAGVTPGSIAHIEFDEAPEDVVVIQANANQIQAFFQFDHPAQTACIVNTICGQPAPLCMSYGQFLVVAGDPNNPHLLYRSKGDQPEAFPAVPADGSVAISASGTPDNPILNLCEFRGQILTLNLSGLFETAIVNGSLIQPAARVATRGMRSRFAFCKTETEVWFVSDDGVYSWDGSSTRKRSEAIDPLFRGQIYNRMEPLDLSAAGIQYLQMEYYRGEVYLIYQDASAAKNPQVLKCNPGFQDRWSLHDFNLARDPVLKIDCLYAEPDTGSMIFARHDPGGVVFSMVDTVALNHLAGLNYTNDEYTADPQTSGGGIFFNCALPWFDLGSPALMKTIQEAWLEVFCHVGSTLFVQVYLDYDESTPVDTFPIPAQSTSWNLVPLLPNLQTVAGHATAFGRECRAISFFISGQTSFRQIAFRSLNFLYQETGLITGGGPRDWSDIGYKYDKRLYQMTVEYDTRGIGQTLILDTVRGRDGATYLTGEAAGLTFPLSNPVIVGAGRAKQTFPIPDRTIVKLVRLRSIAAASNPPSPGFRILDLQFEKEDYPPDIVSMTKWEDGGSEYDKYCNQVDVEVNTNGVAVNCQLQADGGVSLGPPFAITSTETDRRRNLSPPGPFKGRMWRLFTDPNQAALTVGVGMFQLFSHRLAFQQADPGEINLTADWRDDGWKWDKRLQVVTIEWDASDDVPNANVQFGLDIIFGIDGNFTQLNAQTLNLNTTALFGLGRHQKAFPLPEGVVVKKFRLTPLTTIPVQFRSWSYSVAFEKFPADVVLFTEPKDFEYPYDKEGQVASIMIDTGGIPCRVEVISDSGAPPGSDNLFSVTTAINDWRRELPLPPNQVGRLWHLRLAPGAGGKAQLFDWNLQFVKNPPYLISFTEWENGGSEYLKYANQIDLDVNTNGFQVFFVVQADGVTVGNPLPVQTTYTDRRRNLTLPPNLAGKEWRLLIDLTQSAIALGGWFQLFSHRFVFRPADKGEVEHSFDWQDLGHPYDKRLHVMTCEWDNTGGLDVIMQMDLLSGIDGGTIQPGVMTFPLGANSGRHEKTFPLRDGLISKKVRVYPQGAALPLEFRTWKYQIEHEKFPADIVLFTEPQDFGWPYDKIGRNLVLTIDTGGVPCAVQPVVDGSIVGPFITITTTLDDWQRILPLQSSPNIIGKLWKLLFQPGPGGKAQLFKWNLDYVKEPPAVNTWDSFEQAFGYSGWKVLKEIFIQYTCDTPLTMQWESDTGVFQVTLPAHPVASSDNFRNAERVLFPAEWLSNDPAQSSGLNKSKVYSVHFSALTAFKLYTDCSGILWFPIGQDRHSAYNTTLLSEFMAIPIGAA